MCQALGDMLNSIVSNSESEKRPIVIEMIIIVSHVGALVSERETYYWWMFAISGPKPSPELSFDF